MATPLSIEEQHLLEQNLSIVKSSFIIMIRALSVIHSLRLYRGDGNRTWSEFCTTELDFSPRMGHYFITAFSILETIEAYNQTAPDPLPLPNKEAQTRALSDAPKELIIDVWQATTAKYGDSPTARHIKETIADMTISEALILRGVTDGAVLSALENLADKSPHGAGVVSELLNTGYLQPGDDEDAIPLQDIRIADLRHYEDNQRREAIARRIADSGGVTVVIYPNDPIKTAGVLRGVMTDEQAYDLWFNLGESTK